MELLVTVALVCVVSAIAIPSLSGSTARNSVWTASEQIGSQIRQARLKAISRNMSFRVKFDCPAVGQYRLLEVTGVPATDNAANRCNTYLQYDSGIFTLPQRTSYGNPPTLTVNSRGVYSSTSAIPSTITVSYNGGEASRSLTMSATGQISFETY